MTPGIAKNISVLDEPLSCWMVEDAATVEVTLLDKFLDILATAELPGTGEQIQVAIENQYGRADADHFGRLVGWYMPETGATMGVLIAETFDPQLVKAVGDGQVLRPDHGIWLVEACGYVVGDRPIVTYSTRACSLLRTERIKREQAFAKGRGGGGGSQAAYQAEADRRAAALFDYLAQTSTGWLARALHKAGATAKSGYYRWLTENDGSTCHVLLFVGTDRITVGSCYLNGVFDPATLETMAAVNQNFEVEPAPDRRYLRGTWWDLRRDLGRDTPMALLPESLGDDIQRSIDAIRPAIDAHQAALKSSLTQGLTT